MENASFEGEETVADVVTEEPIEQNPNEAEEDQQALRRSSRESRPTERMALYMQTEFEKGEKKLSSVYNDWQFNVKKLRNILRTDSDHTDIAETSETVKVLENTVLKHFEELRTKGTIAPLLMKRIDALVSITRDINQIVNERLSEIEEFEPQRELSRLKSLRNKDYAQSVFSLWESESNNSNKSVLSEKVADAAAALAEKQAKYEVLQEEEEQLSKFADIEMEQKRALEAHKKEMKKLEARREIKVAQARLNAYAQVYNSDETVPNIIIPPGDIKTEKQTEEDETLVKRASIKNDTSVKAPETQKQNESNLENQDFVNSDERAAFAKVLADSVNLNRLPVPEPNVFAGDPLQFIEWKTSFQTLIERKGIPPEEKIFYLKKYTGGPARKALEGFFYSGSKTAFESAQRVLHERYGHPFVVQKAFRDKLDKWPKIAAKDPIGLRDFADFLQGCKDALPHIPSLRILDDCTENQKLLNKLPDYATVRWNREVIQSMESNGSYPSFSQFVSFLAKEARIACNPISSLYALNSNEDKKSKELRYSGKKAKVLATTAHDSKKPTGEHYIEACLFCNKKGHYIFKCNGFLSLTIDKKRDFIRNNSLCYGCLRKGHLNKDCKRKHTCNVCKGQHPSCLHEDRQYAVNNAPTSASSFRVSRNTEQSTSMIVPVWVSTQENPSQEILTYALLDTQSDTTFILEDTASSLQISGQPIKLSLSTMTSQHTVIESSRVCGLKVRGFNSPDYVSINQAYSRNFIPVDRSHIPNIDTVKTWPHLAPIADEIPPLQSCDVGLLIGYNCPQALAPRNMLIGKDEEPYAVQTLLGWSVIGYVNPSLEAVSMPGVCHRTLVQIKELPPCQPRDVIKVLEKDFDQDGDKDKKVSQEDIHFLNLLDSTIYQRDDKHLEMSLPFKERPVMPNNKHLAVLRLNHLKRKLQNDQKYYGHYKQFMKEIIEREDAELVDTIGENGNIWYIPHHGVYHSKKQDKLRVVFDCSAKYGKTSLNQHLLTGPDLTNGLVGVLCRFRIHPVAIMCDIEKMFHQFLVQEPDRDFLRFLWWEDGDMDKKPLEYRMRVHLFGAASSPGCANYGLKYLAKICQSDLPKASFFVQNDFYVDDGLSSTETEEEAIQLIKDAQELCANGGIHLHKFISNRKRVIDSIPVSERAADVKDLDLALEQLPVERALGVRWCVENDNFKFEITIKNAMATRRNMLSIVASIFDPLGFLAPCTLKGKIILQEMCQRGVDWDDTLPESIRPEWEKWIEDIHNLKYVTIQRPLKPQEFGKPLRIELHHFSDASTTGYGQCSYIRFINENAVHCSLVMAKARVAPHKMVSIPRLELTAAVLSAKISGFLKEELNLVIDREYFWTDSRVVLGYINNEARRFHVFVANRVQMIRNVTDPSQWFYVSTEKNPADHASRGLSASEITSSTWLSGPLFLWQREIETNEIETDLQLGDPEVRTVRSMCTKASGIPDVLERLDRFSSYSKLLSVMARLQRLSNGVKGTHAPTVEERRMAEITILKLVQESAFQNTISSLNKTEKLPQTNPLYPLDPVLHDGLMCVGGRLRKADLPSHCRHPVILPKESHITRLILAHVHQQVEHHGRGMTMNKLRSSGYWIIGGSKVVANFIRQCVICRKLRRPTECQRMADLPTERVVPSPPFTYCGMDCFGPFLVKQGRKEVKRYGLLFTCMCCRAIHIEMLDDMSTDAFINGLRCFIAIRGAVKQIRSDQGTNFIGAKNEFERETKINKVTSFLTKRQCEFVTNAPDASHTGGEWERQIKTVRSVLDAILLQCPGRLDDSSLRTLFYEVSSIVNSRPLAISEIDDPDALEPLTPNHILTAKSEIPQPPPGKFVKEDLLLRKRWRRVQFLLEQFWARWKKEYVSQIALRQKWHERRRNVRVGDVVLVKDVNSPRIEWPLARVTEVRMDDDGLVRKVIVKLARKDTTSTSILERSVHKLVLLIEQ